MKAYIIFRMGPVTHRRLRIGEVDRRRTRTCDLQIQEPQPYPLDP